MYKEFDLPIGKDNMPWLVKDTLRDHRYGDLVEISRHGFGTPDGECDTDSWNMTFVNRVSEVVTFVTYIYKGHDCLALPVMEKISYWVSWQDHGDQYTTTHKDGKHETKIEEVVIDHDKIRRMIFKMLAKKTIEMEAA